MKQFLFGQAFPCFLILNPTAGHKHSDSMFEAYCGIYCIECRLHIFSHPHRRNERICTCDPLA